MFVRNCKRNGRSKLNDLSISINGNNWAIQILDYTITPTLFYVSNDDLFMFLFLFKYEVNRRDGCKMFILFERRVFRLISFQDTHVKVLKIGMEFRFK